MAIRGVDPGGWGSEHPWNQNLAFLGGQGSSPWRGQRGGGWSAPQEKLSSDFSGILTSQPPLDLHLWCQCTHKLSRAPWGPLSYLCVVAIANFLGIHKRPYTAKWDLLRCQGQLKLNSQAGPQAGASWGPRSRGSWAPWAPYNWAPLTWCTCLKNPGYVYATPHYVCHFEGHLTPLLPELLTVPLSSKYRNYSQKSIGSRGLICRLSARYIWQPHDVSSGKTCTCAFLGRLLSFWCIYFLIFWVWKILITLASVQPFHLLDRIVIESGQGWTFYDILDFMEKISHTLCIT